MLSHFQLFRLPEKYDLDITQLEQTHRNLIAQFHPDKFAAASPFEQKQAVMMTATLNEAYRVLRHPLDRAAYLLQTHGIHADAPEHTHFPPDFLMQQMQWRETLMDAKMDNNTAAIAELNQTIQTELSEVYQQIQAAFDGNQLEKVAEWIRKGRFLAKLIQDIQD